MSEFAVSAPSAIGGVALPWFACRRSDDDREARIVASGELDVATAPLLEEALRDAQADRALVVVDLHELRFMGAVGVRVLREAEHRAEASGGRLVVERPSAEIERLLGLEWLRRRAGDPDRAALAA